MQILTRHNKVIDYCPNDSYICMDSTVICVDKQKSFDNCTLITVESLPTDINRYEYYYIDGKFVKEDLNLQNLLADTLSIAKTTTFNEDGSITESTAEGYKKVTVFNDDGSITESYYNCETLVRVKTTVFNDDGSISEAIKEV